MHALGQVFHFETNKNIPAIQYERALNALLPKDIRILKTEEMPDDFHARFSAVAKRYDYSWDLMILRVLHRVKSILESLELKRFQILKLMKKVQMCILSLRVQVF